MEISFILLNYKQKGLIKQSIKGINQCNIQMLYEIIVVDNNSNDGCIGMIQKEFPKILTLQLPKNVGFAAGNNAGIKASTGRYIIIMNPDIALTENTVENLLHFLQTHPNAGMVGPKLINPDGTIQFSCCRFPNFLTPLYRRTILGKFAFAKKSINSYLMKDWDHKSTKKVDWLFGAFLVIKKESFEKAGYFDERFFLYYEDLDLCRRFWEKNLEVWYAHDIELVHYHQRLSAKKQGIVSLFDKSTRTHISSSIKYLIKYFRVKLPEIK